MSIEVARVGFGVPCAMLVPFCLTWLRNTPISRLVMAIALALVALAPFLDELRGWLVFGIVVVGQAVLTSRLDAVASKNASSSASRPQLDATSWVVIVAVSASVVALVIFRPQNAADLWDAIWRDSSSGMVIAFGALTATLAYGVVVEALIGRVGASIAEVKKAATMPGVPKAGQIIGWLERAATFAAVLLGHPEALVLILGTKSLARLPQFKDEAFGEYFQIGSLLSIGGAVLIALVTRVALGDSAL